MAAIPRVVDVHDGVAMIVTDLHGDLRAFEAYRDRFLAEQAAGTLDRLILCGDLIHGNGPVNTDGSLTMLQAVMDMQDRFGAEVVIMLMGNHELPHIYGLPLSRGTVEYTPRFEAILSRAGGTVRDTVLAFLAGLPFFVRTAAGVMITHCGASALAALPQSRDLLAHFDHQAMLARWQEAMQQEDRKSLLLGYERMTGQSYDDAVRYHLAVSGEDDPRYWDLLRAIFFNASDPDFELLWQTFFTRNEHETDEAAYADIAAQFLQTWSEGAPSPLRALVAGHIGVNGGYRLVNEYQLRLASSAHAHPHDAGKYLRLDCAVPVPGAAALIPHLGSVFEA